MGSSGISFVGLNSSFDSGALIEQLINLETQNRIQPLQRKRAAFNQDANNLDETTNRIGTVKTNINFNAIMKGETSLSPKLVTSSDTDKEFVTVTTTDEASTQQFDINVSQLATHTKRQSSASVVNTLTSASLNSVANFKASTTLANGTVTVNGVTQTFSNSSGTLGDIETFLSSFAGVTATFNTGTGRFDMTGLTSLGSSGDTSNLLSALGVSNAPISGGNVSGLQNLETVKESSTLTSLGITGTQITINGTAVTYNIATDTIGTLVAKITNTAAAKVGASYNAVEGKLILANDNTGALSIPVSSDGNILTALNLNNPSSETLGDNAEFTISNLYGGATIVNNTNSVADLIQGITIDLTKVTSSAVTVTISEDSSGAKKKVQDILSSVNSLLTSLASKNDSFSRTIIGKIKSTLTSEVTAATNTYKSLIAVGLESSLDGNNKFSGYSIDEDLFDTAFEDDQEDLYKILYGSSNSESIYGTLSNGSDGLISQLQTILDEYVDPQVSSEGIISQVRETIQSSIKTTNEKIDREQRSIDALEARYRKQFAQLDVINARFQQQQAAVNGLTQQQ